MTCYKFFAGVFLIAIPAIGYCQETPAFESILTAKKIGKVYRIASVNDTTWLTYLGKLKGIRMKDKYYVIKEFFKVRAASTWHGHSTIYFYGLNKKRKALVHVSMPDNLPYKLKNNVFYFRYIENGMPNIYTMKMHLPLPKMFCSRKNDCYDITFE
jgi:hypothetical protein